MRILLATSNAGKIREIRLALARAPVTVVTLQDVAQEVTEPEETGVTFAENAALKARYYSRATGLPAVAEDSGLAIDALDGRPGVLSARYPGATYADKFANLYRELAPHPRPWTARFVCSLAFIDFIDAEGRLPQPTERAPVRAPAFTAEATVEGAIAAEPRGTHGFGYDPIFFYPPLARTTGEMTDEQKLAISHRGQAFREFARWLGR